MKGTTTGLIGIIALLSISGEGLRAAQAASRSEKAQAREQFEIGEAHYNLREFDRALESFKNAYRMTRDPALLFNIGQCQYKLGDLAGALYSFKAYLRGGREPANRVQVEARIAEIEKKMKGDAPAEPKPAVESRAEPDAGSAQEVNAAPALDAVPDAKAEPSPAADTPADSGERPVLPSPPAATVLPIAVLPPPETTVTTVGSVPVPGGRSADSEARPFYTRWWFWTAVGVVVAGSVAALLLLPRGVERPSCPEGVTCG